MQEDASRGGFVGRILLSVSGLSSVSKHYCRDDTKDSDSGWVSGSGNPCFGVGGLDWVSKGTNQVSQRLGWVSTTDSAQGSPDAAWLGVPGSGMLVESPVIGDQVKPPLGGLSAHSRASGLPMSYQPRRRRMTCFLFRTESATVFD